MSEAFRKVRSGEPLNIPAAAYNAFIDAALANRRNENAIGREPKQSQRDRSVVSIRNDSGIDAPRFGVLGVDGSLFVASAAGFTTQNPLIGVAPIEPTSRDAGHFGRFVITTAPIKAGAVGKALVSGVCPVMLDVESETPEPLFADIADGQIDRLNPSSSGAATIFWREGGTGVQWSIVRLGEGQKGPVFPITLTQVGGSAGDASNPTTWTYDVVGALSGETIDTAVDPTADPHQWRRPGAGQLSAATFGYAHFDGAGALVIGWINEVVEPEACA